MLNPDSVIAKKNIEAEVVTSVMKDKSEFKA